MKRIHPWHIFIMICTLFLLTGCSGIGDKTTSMSVIYLITTAFSILLLIGYIFMMKDKEHWFIVLFSSVVIVNTGYLALSLSKTLDTALFANRIAYLGSVFLPLSMFFTILKVCKVPYKKWLVCLLGGISIAIFLIAASPGILDIYYKDVSLEMINGVAVLKKEYGKWHSIYLYYLVLYFAAMICVTVVSALTKRIRSVFHAVVILAAVFSNICVWLLEQLVPIDFEFLSVSYIITEIFFLQIYLIVQNAEKLFVSEYGYSSSFGTAVNTSSVSQTDDSAAQFADQCARFTQNLLELTNTERRIYDLYVNGKSTKDILAELGIKENTLKYHNKNIYSKLGVSSRKQLIGIAKHLENQQ